VADELPAAGIDITVIAIKKNGRRIFAQPSFSLVCIILSYLEFFQGAA
jgi:hypothetical protein